MRSAVGHRLHPPATERLELSPARVTARHGGAEVLVGERALVNRVDVGVPHSNITLSVTRGVTPVYRCNELHHPRYTQEFGVTPSGVTIGVTPKHYTRCYTLHWCYDLV